MKRAVKHIVAGTKEKIEHKIFSWKAEYLFYDGRKWRQDECYFETKPEFDRPHKIFGTKCLRVKGE